jgi:EAL domain-containing protein (putative c-di-GMP-specific phosphodiesterase class I)/GGDEF domain-containing protein
MKSMKRQTTAAEMIEQLRFERDRHVAFAFAAADLLIEARADSTIVAASGAVHAILGREKSTLIGSHVEHIVAARDRPLLRRLLVQLQKVGRLDPAALHLARADGTSIRVLVGGCQLPDLTNRVFLSVTLLPSAIAPMPQPRDEATGLLTLESLRDAAQRASIEDGNGGRELKLLRLDGLAGAVRQLAPERATLLMEEIGAALRATSIGGDAAGRLGDDAFGIVAKHSDDPDREAALVADLQEAIRDAGVPDGEVGPSVARIDLSLGALNDGDAGRALTYAMSRFVADLGGEFTIGSLRTGLAAAVNETVGRFAETRRIIAAGDFALVYQPVVDLAARGLHHHESLLRFPGKANTFETVVFSEDVGLVCELDIAVCKQAITALLQSPDAAVAVNLSGRSVQNESFRAALGTLVRPLGIQRRRLMFELTESAAIDDLEEAAAFLRWLRSMEHRICLDDFGAGAAAYSYLRRFDVDFVKIDGPFLKSAVELDRERALIRSICVLCKEIGCKVIGEMIETEQEAAQAAAMGIEYGQGWLFGKPVAELPKPALAVQRSARAAGWR